jgi:hypothetical protein
VVALIRLVVVKLVAVINVFEADVVIVKTLVVVVCGSSRSSS